MRRGSPRGGLRVSVVGATGLVGKELLKVLERRRFPLSELRCFSSGKTRSAVSFRGKALAAPAPDRSLLASSDLVFFVSADGVSSRLAPALAARGVWVIDDSAAFRLDPKVPLVIPEVNPEALHPARRLIAGPNCSMAPVAVAGIVLHRVALATEARIATYQAVAGAGRAALEEFVDQNRRQSRRLDLSAGAPVLPAVGAKALPRDIAFNVIPQVGSFRPDGLCGEEFKIAAELRKVWAAPRLRVSATTVRVPTLRGHCMAVWLSFRKSLSLPRALKLLRAAPGVEFSAGENYPTPLDAAGKDPVFAGRLRRGAAPDELCLWLVSDSLLKGAAVNSIQVAEELLRRGWLRRR